MSHLKLLANQARFSVTAIVAVMSVMVIAATPVASADDTTKSDAMSMPAGKMDHSKMSGMKGMSGMKHMDGMSMTGDVDFDFATNMRKHHQMALDMAQAEIKNGKDATMVQMSKDIVASQSKEIAAFDQWLAAHKPAMSQPMSKGK